MGRQLFDILCITVVSAVLASCASSRPAPILWDVGWSPDGKQIVVCGEGTLNIEHVSSGTSLFFGEPEPGGPESTTFTRARWPPTGAQLAVVTQGHNASGFFGTTSGFHRRLDAPN